MVNVSKNILFQRIELWIKCVNVQNQDQHLVSSCTGLHRGLPGVSYTDEHMSQNPKIYKTYNDSKFERRERNDATCRWLESTFIDGKILKIILVNGYMDMLSQLRYIIIK